MTGRFICLEGLDGCGKTTQLDKLENFLNQKMVQVMRVREPGGTMLGEGIRELLLKSDQPTMASSAELLLFFAARAQLVQEKIAPALEKGIWVLADRFVWASYAYQGYGRGVSLQLIDHLRDLACGKFLPDLTLVLEISHEERLKRLKGTGKIADRLENEKADFFARVDRGFKELSELYPKRIQLCDASGDLEHVHRTLVSAITYLLP